MVNSAFTPLNCTLVIPFRFSPSMVTIVPLAPRAGENPVSRGATTKSARLTPVPVGLVTRRRPVMALRGTTAMSRPLVRIWKSARTVSNSTWVAVDSPVPVTKTWTPGAPHAGVKPVIVGAAIKEWPANNKPSAAKRRHFISELPRSLHALPPSRNRILTPPRQWP